MIRGTGNVEVGNLSCAFCHTRVLPDGSVAKGAQSNFPFDKAIVYRDLMRYASMAQGIEFLSSFGGFIPSGEENFSKLPPPETQQRFSDEQLYALAMYLYSLRPPSNPHRNDALAQAGRKVFEKEACAVRIYESAAAVNSFSYFSAFMNTALRRPEHVNTRKQLVLFARCE